MSYLIIVTCHSFCLIFCSSLALHSLNWETDWLKCSNWTCDLREFKVSVDCWLWPVHWMDWFCYFWCWHDLRGQHANCPGTSCTQNTLKSQIQHMYLKRCQQTNSVICTLNVRCQIFSCLVIWSHMQSHLCKCFFEPSSNDCTYCSFVDLFQQI